MTRSFIFLCYFSLVGVSGTDTVKDVSVTEGESVTFHSDITEVQINDEIRWLFGAIKALIANIDKNRISLKDYPDGRFSNRLHLDNQTGSLTINNITKTHSGPYQLTIKIGGKDTLKNFNLTVFSRLPVPDINFPQSSLSSSSSSKSKCSVVCSVMNVSAATLSWYEGNSLLSSISLSDLSIGLFLPLEVEYQDNNTYSCVINNTISNQTTHLDITFCEGCLCCCGFTEAVIRLAFSALVGVATLAVLFYDITFTNTKQKRNEQASS